MTTDFRALCAELLQPLAEYDSANPYHEHRDLITRARAALAQPAPVAPTDEELLRLACMTDLVYDDGYGAFPSSFVEGTDTTREALSFARAVLARWGCPECVRELRESLKNLQEIAARHVDELDDLRDCSGGVYGLHHNDDEAPWSDVFPGGHYEQLSALEELRDAIVSHEIVAMLFLDDKQPQAAQRVLQPADLSHLSDEDFFALCPQGHHAP